MSKVPIFTLFLSAIYARHKKQMISWQQTYEYQNIERVSQTRWLDNAVYWIILIGYRLFLFFSPYSWPIRKEDFNGYKLHTCTNLSKEDPRGWRSAFKCSHTNGAAMCCYITMSAPCSLVPFPLGNLKTVPSLSIEALTPSYSYSGLYLFLYNIASSWGQAIMSLILCDTYSTYFPCDSFFWVLFFYY